MPLSTCLRSESLMNFKKRKFHIVLAMAIVVTIFLIFFFTSSNGTPLNQHQRNPRLDLKLVHVFFRHGSRTPQDTYPKDIYVNETFFPYGWGQLTNDGKRQMYELGEFLKLRYNNFLSETLNLNEIHAQSTDVQRTKTSLQLVLAAMFPPKNTPLEWNVNLNWQPIPYIYQNISSDTLLIVNKPCPRYHEEFHRVINEDIKEELDRNSQMLEDITNITGLSIKTPDDVQNLYSTLKAERDFGLKLPKWTEKYFPDRMQNLTDFSYYLKSYNSLLKRLKGGLFLKRAILNWKEKISNMSKKKIFIYAGHDLSVAIILAAFNVWDIQFPDYAITGILEFSQHKDTGEFGVEILLRNTTKSIPYTLRIPGCEDFCEITKLEEILNENVPTDWEEECKPIQEGFTAPPPGGP